MRIFLLLIFGLALITLVIVYDQLRLYMYFPRMVVAIPLFFIAAATVIKILGNRIYGAASGVAIVVLLFAVAPFAFTPLKKFYINCGEIPRDASRMQVDEIMGQYSTDISAWGHVQPASIREVDSDSERTPYIYTPDLDHDSDFCMIYFKDGIVRDVVISPD